MSRSKQSVDFLTFCAIIRDAEEPPLEEVVDARRWENVARLCEKIDRTPLVHTLIIAGWQAPYIQVAREGVLLCIVGRCTEIPKGFHTVQLENMRISAKLAKTLERRRVHLTLKNCRAWGSAKRILHKLQPIKCH